MQAPEHEISSNSSFNGTFDLAPGTVIGLQYRVERKLGDGGMSVVYQCTDLSVGRTVAVKLMHPQALTDGRSHMRFQQEARAVARLDHPSIVKFYMFSLANDVPFIVMDYVEGATLCELIAAQGALPVAHTVKILLQVVNGLEHAHENDVVHRDLKPSNVIVRSDDSAVIVDFGIAKIETSAILAHATQTGEVFGSPSYMSPEQVSGKITDARADQYALGCILFECLTGLPPFSGGSVEIMFAHLNEVPTSLREASLGRELPPGFQGIVSKLLAKNPNDRYQSMAEVRDALLNLSSPSKLRAVAKPSLALKSKHVQKTAWHKNKSVVAFAALTVCLMIAIPLAINLLSRGKSIGLALPAQAALSRGGETSVSDAAADAKKRAERDAINSERDAIKSAHAASAEKDMERSEVSMWTANLSLNLQTPVLTLDSHEDPSLKFAVNNGLTDADLSSLSKMHALEKIVIFCCPNITGSCLEHLDGSNVKELRISDCAQIKNESLVWLKNFPELKRLNIRATPVSDDGLKYIGALKTLTTLQLSNDPNIRGSGLAVIGQLKQLLKFEGTNIGIKKSAKYFGASKIHILRLSNTSITDDDIKEIAKDSDLQELSIDTCSGLTPACLKYLEHLHLRSLDVGTTKVEGSKELAAFKANHPHCAIKLTPPEFDFKRTMKGVGIVKSISND